MKDNSQPQNSFLNTFNNTSFLLTEGAIIERLKREFCIHLDKDILPAGLIYDEKGIEVLSLIYKQYIDIADFYNIPIMLMTPTRRATVERINRSIYHDKSVIKDCVEFLEDLRENYPSHKNKIFIGGLMGCKGDAYNPNEALETSEAYEFHKLQAELFKQTNVDFLFAGVLPAKSEAIGIAKAMAETGIPYILSFVIRKSGSLLDGTIINDIIVEIDNTITPKPLCYMVNCVHPVVLQEALSNPLNKTALVRERLIGIQANTSTASPEDLNNNINLQTDDFDILINSMIELKDNNNFKILGGCCGTDNRHIEELARRATKDTNTDII
ncbi:homocysteine S-methyltransferase family protein [Clostridium sp. DSM 17811]|nr:homocysteine S-methyltransferase family protein [Clostridium sp. DSM 17811]MBU3098568.1 homocysteine S-methyltransferase family protein [Clostridium sp. DSM 17811]